MLVLILAFSANLILARPSSPDAGTTGLASWNPNVSCAADQVTIRDVLGPAYPRQTVSGSRYQTNSTAGGVPQERALSPPCTITNVTGQVWSSFVQINGVSLYGYGVKTSDCSGWYSKQNGGGRYPDNQTHCTNAGQIITIGTKSGYMKIEIDRDWLGKGYCGPSVPSCDNATLAQEQSNGTISLDVQGFVFWEGPYHWELHALTAWRLTPPPDFGTAANPSSLSIKLGSSGTSSIGLSSLYGFSGNVSLTASISSSGLVLVWPTVSLNPTSVALTSGGSGTSTLTVSTSLLTTLGTYTVTVTATSGSITHSTTVTVEVTLPI